MTSQIASEDAARAVTLRQLSLAADDDTAAPILAGMRARAIADFCDRWGLPAILLDRLGRVLHIGAAAEAFLGDGLTVSAGHLVSHSPAGNLAVEQAVATAIGGEPSVEHGGETADASALDVIGLCYRDPSPYQMLRGVLVLGLRAMRAQDEVAALRHLLAA